MRDFIPAILFLGLAASGFAGEGNVTVPPAAEVKRLNLDPFYRKHLSVNGFPVVSSEKVSDYALLEAGFLIEKMLSHRPDILEAITAAGVRFAIMAPDEFTTDIPEHSDHTPPEYWDKRARGLGSTTKRPAVSCGEENLLCYPGDPYGTENIFIHEFAHTIHHQGLAAVDPGFQKRLEKVFGRARIEGLWKGKYAGKNPAEYWAEGVQSWFDTNREDDHDHNHVDTREELREYDPRLAKLVEEVFGDGKWRYRRPKDRKSPGHLAGYDPEKAPTFAWPPELIAAYEAIQRGDHLEKLKPLPLTASEPADRKSARSGKAVQLRIDNQTAKTVRVFWIDFDGNHSNRGQVDPGRSFDQETFHGHLWLVTDMKDQPLALFEAARKPCLGIVEDR